MSEVTIISATGADDHHFNDELLAAVGGLGFETPIIPYAQASNQIARLKASRAVIVAGVPLHYPFETAEDLLPSLKQWLPEVDAAVLGICLGHQAMGLVFGASMRRNEEVERGTCIVEVADGHQGEPLFKNMGRRFEVESFHRASISVAMAPRLDRLASSLPKPGVSTGCENAVVRVVDKPYYATQFHPEKSEVGKLLLRNFLELPKP